MLPASELLALQAEKNRLNEIIDKLEIPQGRQFIRAAASFTTKSANGQAPLHKDCFFNFQTSGEIPPEFFDFIATYKARLLIERGDIWTKIEKLLIQKA